MIDLGSLKYQDFLPNILIMQKTIWDFVYVVLHYYNPNPRQHWEIWFSFFFSLFLKPIFA